MELQMLVNRIKAANEAYRKGEAIMTDAEWDSLMDELKLIDPINPLINQIGLSPDRSDPRKETLPIFMGSLDKIKTLKEIQKWISDKFLEEELLVATGKYDGLSLLVHELTDTAWTRGDGFIGLNVSKHYSSTRKGSGLHSVLAQYTWGEAIIPKSVFKAKYSKEYKNPRNMVASLFNTKVPDPEKLKDVVYLRYGAYKPATSWTKINQLEVCKVLNAVEVPFFVFKSKGVTIENLNTIYNNFNMQDFEVDGVVLDIEKFDIRDKVGKESNGNPAYARAFKGNFEEVKKTTVNNIRWQISKHRALIPVMEVTSVNLEGADVTNVTAYNANYLIEQKIDIGVDILLKRSGKVIPKVVEVLTPVSSVNIPYICPCCNSLVKWDETHVNIYCTNLECPDSVIARNLAFFEELKIELGEPSIRKFYEAGYKTISSICNLGWDKIETIEGFGFVSANNLVDDIKNALKKASLKELMAASGYFPGLGLKTLNLIDFLIDVNWLDDSECYYNEQHYKLLGISGIGEESAKIYLANLSNFYDFLRGLNNVPFRVWDYEESKGDKFKNQVIVFSGFRDSDLEKLINKESGKVSDSVSANTTLIVTKGFASSSKLVKGEKLGIEIIELTNFKEKYKV